MTNKTGFFCLYDKRTLHATTKNVHHISQVEGKKEKKLN
jgi:hypothetical protein